MTIRKPKKNILDSILNLFGKERGIEVPLDPYKKYGPYVYIKAKYESFWKSLFRGKKNKGQNLNRS